MCQKRFSSLTQYFICNIAKTLWNAAVILL